MRRHLFAVLGAVMSLAACTQPAPPAPPPPVAAAPAPPAKNDYADGANWLCRPGRNDACSADLTATVVYANGATKKEEWKADPNAPIDCFYIYPTVSRDPGVISDMNAGPEEKNVIAAQFARFGAKCRLYAPLYRQFTLTALRAMQTGHPLPGAADVRPATTYDDVLDAWNYYLQHDNHGRGVVLIGHSQGSGLLQRLIANEIDGKPVQARLVSALLLGTVVQVPDGKDVGATFKTIPLCHAKAQTGCVIVYSTFRDTVPPLATTRFGRSAGPGLHAACVNPAAPAGGKALLNAYMPARTAAEWVKGKTIETAWVRPPGLFAARCVTSNDHTYLSVHINANPKDPRTDDIVADVPGPDGKPDPNWGLHLVDVNIALGDLVADVGAEAKAYTKAH